MGESGVSYWFLEGRPEGRWPLVRQGIDERIILKWIFYV